MSALKGKTALVTGGSRGIGRAIVDRLARDGASIVFSFARDDVSAATVEASTPGARAVQADLADRAAAVALFDTTEQRLGGLDILVNNAGSSTVPAPISQTGDADYDQIMAVNTRAVFMLMRVAATSAPAAACPDSDSDSPGQRRAPRHRRAPRPPVDRS